MTKDDPEEYGRRLAEKTSIEMKPHLDHIARTSAASALIADIYKVLIEQRLITQDEAVARIEKVSNAIFALDLGISDAHAISFIDIVRDTVAGKGKAPDA